MKIPELTIGNITAPIPIVQGGMGVRVSLSSLAAAVANEGGIGTISSIGLGDIEESKSKFEEKSREALVTEIKKAQKLTSGHLAVNIMGVLSNADDVVLTCVSAGIKLIVFGAGLPTKLPALVPDPSVNLIPIISSARVTELILRTWDRKFGRTADAFVLEGPKAGGHLGFSEEQLMHIEDYSLEKLLPEVLESVKPYEDKYQRRIPIIAAGGIYTGKDIALMLSLGAAGVQMGTRFVCTHECGVSKEFKQAYLNSKKEDMTIIKSPVGMPARAIWNPFLAELADDTKPRKVKCPYRCLTACKIETARYCIANALVNSYFGDTDHGIIFCGENAYRVDKIVSVKELITELLEELAAE
ncbi:MAG: nitronate monooxygenase family protein [Planctomycetota bacterium]